MRNRYESELENLNLDLIRMGAMAETAIRSAMKALNGSDAQLARRIIEDDDLVDGMARQIESRSMKLIMKQQPVAKDLRAVSAALKMITDIERICDQAADIAEMSATMRPGPGFQRPSHIEAMGRLAVEMVRTAVDSYVKLDTELTDKVIAMDDRQDELFNTVKNELVDSMLRDRKDVDASIDYLLIAKYLERISDHAENIAGWTAFAVTGIHKHERIL